MCADNEQSVSLSKAKWDSILTILNTVEETEYGGDNIDTGDEIGTIQEHIRQQLNENS